MYGAVMQWLAHHAVNLATRVANISGECCLNRSWAPTLCQPPLTSVKYG